jgi:hypothetical protein
MNMTNLIKLAAAIILTVLISACGGGEADEAKKLGFASVDEMKDIHAKGWHTKARYEEDEAKRQGFSSVAEMRAAIAKKKEEENDNKVILELQPLFVKFSKIADDAKELVASANNGALTWKQVGAKQKKMSDDHSELAKEISKLKTSNDELQRGIDSFLKVSQLHAELFKLTGSINESNEDMSKEQEDRQKSLNAEIAQHNTNVVSMLDKYGLNSGKDELHKPASQDNNANDSRIISDLAEELGVTKIADCALTVGVYSAGIIDKEKYRALEALSRVYYKLFDRFVLSDAEKKALNAHLMAIDQARTNAQKGDNLKGCMNMVKDTRFKSLYVKEVPVVTGELRDKGLY